MNPLETLTQLGLTLPAPPAPGGNYTSAKTSGNIVYLSGVISQTAEGIITGTVGLDRTIEDGYAAARSCALFQLAVLQQHLGSLDKVRSILTVNGYVNSVPASRTRPRSSTARAICCSRSSASPAATCAPPSASAACRATHWSSYR